MTVTLGRNNQESIQTGLSDLHNIFTPTLTGPMTVDTAVGLSCTKKPWIA